MTYSSKSLPFYGLFKKFGFTWTVSNLRDRPFIEPAAQRNLSRVQGTKEETLNDSAPARFEQTTASSVIGPDGKVMTFADLPPANTKRWVVKRKAVVVFAVRAGLLTLEQACERYSLSVEEFMSWQRLIESHGMRGLRTTRLQQYRNSRLRRRV